MPQEEELCGIVLGLGEEPWAAADEGVAEGS